MILNTDLVLSVNTPVSYAASPGSSVLRAGKTRSRRALEWIIGKLFLQILKDFLLLGLFGKSCVAPQ